MTERGSSRSCSQRAANEVVDTLDAAFPGAPQAIGNDSDDFLDEILEGSIFQSPGSAILGDPARRGIAAMATIDIRKSARELLRRNVAGASRSSAGGRQ